jgi:hypothetical protein
MFLTQQQLLHVTEATSNRLFNTQFLRILFADMSLFLLIVHKTQAAYVS